MASSLVTEVIRIPYKGGFLLSCLSRPKGFDLSACVIYLHGFPDQSVDHRGECPELYGMPCTRMARKCVEFFPSVTSSGDLTDGDSTCSATGCVVFNFRGTPGSDSGCAFEDKTVSMELQDVRVVMAYIQANYGAATTTTSTSTLQPIRFHLVGLSTGAIVASLARSREFQRSLAEAKLVLQTITVIAGCGAGDGGMRAACKYDFDDCQLADMDTDGCCLKEFWLPVGSSSNPPHEARGDDDDDGEVPVKDPRKSAWKPCQMKLDKGYVEDFLDLNVAESVNWTELEEKEDPGECGSMQLHVPGLLVIHGGKDLSIPSEEGEQLFAIAREPKEWLFLPKANHLLGSSRDLNKALKKMRAFQSQP